VNRSQIYHQALIKGRISKKAADAVERKGRQLRRVLSDAARKGWDVADSGPRHRALRDLRAYAKNRDAIWALRKRCIRAGVPLKRKAVGAARPYDLGNLRWVLESQGLQPRAIEVLAWAKGVCRGFSRPGLIAAHSEWAGLLGCSQRTAGSAVRAAVASGYLIRLPWFALRPAQLFSGEGRQSRHVQRECCYRLSDKFDALQQSQSNRGVVASLLVGKICQPSEIQSPTDSKGIPSDCRGGEKPTLRPHERAPMTYEHLNRLADDFQSVLQAANAAFEARPNTKPA
jgi:hypothetical protein